MEAMDKEGISHCGTRKAGESRIKSVSYTHLLIVVEKN